MIWIRIRVKSWIRLRIHIKAKIRSYIGSKQAHGGPWTLTMDAWGLKMEPWRIRPVVEDSHHYDEEQDLDWWIGERQNPDPDPHRREKLDPDPHYQVVKDKIRILIRTEVKSWIRIRIKLMRICNPDRKNKKSWCLTVRYKYVTIQHLLQ